MTGKPLQRKVWDWTVRLFHWLIVPIIMLMWWTAEEGYMDWHRRLGVTMLGLIVFRIVWGFIGSWTARFLPMVKRLKSLGKYVNDIRSGNHKPTYGHGALGVLSVFAMLALILLQVATGLFSVDVDGLESGPLAVLVSFDIGREFADFHELNFDILSIVIMLHIAAILFYRFKLNDSLIKPMVTGTRDQDDFLITDLPETVVKPVPLIVSTLLAASSVYAVLNLA